MSASGTQRFYIRGHDLQMGYTRVAIEVLNISPHRYNLGELDDLLPGVEDICNDNFCEFEYAVGDGPSIGKGRVYEVSG